MSENQRRLALALTAVVVLALLWRANSGRGTSLSAFAQLESQPASPPGTATWTPTFTETPSPTPLGSVTPTPTRSRVVVNEIRAPKSGDAVAGQVSIFGTALIKAYRRYDVHISPAGNEEWRWLSTNYDVIRDGILHSFDTTELPDGFYDLRVRAIADYGNYNEAYVRRIEIRNANPPTPTPFVDAAGVQRVIAPTATATPTVTPVPINESRTTGGRGIYAPDSGAVLRGYIPIIATVNGDRYFPFARYEIAISPAGADNWQWLFSGEQQFWQDEIFLLDTQVFDDGYYDLRLRNVFEDGNYGEYFVRSLRFINHSTPAPGTIFSPPSVQQPATRLGFSSPLDGSRIAAVVDFRGAAFDPDFLRWEMYWSPTGAETWSFLVSSERPVENGSLARLDLSQLPYGLYDFRLRIVRQDTNYEDYFVRNLNVTSPTPTPQPSPTPTLTSTPAG